MNNHTKFIEYCSTGDLENVQSLYYNLGEVNTHRVIQLGFRTSCFSGHLEVAQWLYNLGRVDIRFEGDYAFLTSCEFGKLEIVQWLCEICNNYEFIKIYDDDIENYYQLFPKILTDDVINFKNMEKYINNNCNIIYHNYVSLHL